MTAREVMEMEDLKREKAVEQDGKCPVCGMYLTYGRPQLAHRIPQTKANIKKYGKAVIHHPDNMVLVCSLKCNTAVVERSGRPRDMLAKAITSSLTTDT